MPQVKEKVHIRIEPPPLEALNFPITESESLPVFYKTLLVLTFIFSGTSLYLAFLA